MRCIKAKLVKALVSHFGDDDRRIQHALEVTRFAELMLDTESGDEDVILAAALLHDAGIKPAEEIHGYNNGRLQEHYGPPVVRELLKQIGFDPAKTDEVCEIIGSHHTPAGVPGPNFPIIWDADMIVNIGDEMPGTSGEKLESIIENSFKTQTGKLLARKYLAKAP